jgi:hypothetical protein
MQLLSPAAGSQDHSRLEGGPHRGGAIRSRGSRRPLAQGARRSNARQGADNLTVIRTLSLAGKPPQWETFKRHFTFRCPRTGHIVKGQADEPRPGERPHTYHPVQCDACKGSHLIDPTTGETWRDPTELRHSERPHVSERRFRKPWRAEETDACFIIRDHNDQALDRLADSIPRKRRALRLSRSQNPKSSRCQTV